MERPESPYPDEPYRFVVTSMEVSQDDQEAHIVLDGNPRVYDSGTRLTVAYRRNEEDAEALENRLLDCEDDPENAVLEALEEVLQDISQFYDTVTRIALETVGGKLTATVTEDVDNILGYLPIPPQLSNISTVKITDLERISPVGMDVDCVKWRGETYAFKKTGESLKGTLRELTILDRLSNSPSIISLKAIVVNLDGTIRGFLTPFMYFGDLANVFRRKPGARDSADDSEPTAFVWELRHAWACQITQAVVELHAISAFNGDLKPQNVLIGPQGNAILVDFLPMGISDEFAAPEVLEMARDHTTPFESVLTAPTDVYSLGLVLWAVAEEKYRVARPLVRRDKTPKWYIDIVQSCLALDADARPSALEVHALLESGGAQS